MRAVHDLVAGLAARIPNGRCVTWHRSLPVVIMSPTYAVRREPDPNGIA
jgi:hypothetical protein